MEAFERLRFRAIGRYLRHHAPVAKSDHSIFVFDLNDDERIAHSTGQPWNRRERSA
jgi:hypothetical protein